MSEGIEVTDYTQRYKIFYCSTDDLEDTMNELSDKDKHIGIMSIHLIAGGTKVMIVTSIYRPNMQSV